MPAAEDSASDDLLTAESDGGAHGPNVPSALWADFQAAVRALTIVGTTDLPGGTIGRPALFYPVVGLAVGAMLALLDWVVASALSQEIASVLLVAALAIVSGGRQLEGFANTADGLIGGRAREWALTIMRDRRLGTFGAAAVFFLLILKVRAIDLISDPGRVVAFLCAPVLGRWAMVVLAHGSREAGPADAGRKFDRGVTFREFAVASVFSFSLLLVLADASGLGILIAVAGITVGLRIYFHRRLGGITAQTLGAVAETAEAVALLLFAMAS